MYSKQSNQQTITDIERERELAFAQQQSRAEVASINNWYQLRRNQAMMEFQRLENAYNERMAEHSVVWAQRLSNCMIEQEMLQVEDDAIELEQERGNTYTTAVEALPIPRLERQTNVQYLPEHVRNIIDDDILLPDMWDPEFLYGTHIMAPVEADRVVAIVSDDEGSDDEGSEEEEDYAMDIC